MMYCAVQSSSLKQSSNIEPGVCLMPNPKVTFIFARGNNRDTNLASSFATHDFEMTVCMFATFCLAAS